MLGRGRPRDVAPVTADGDTSLDHALVLRLVRDPGGRVIDAVIEFANLPWRSTFAGDGQDPAGERLTAAFPAFADRLDIYERVARTGRPEQLTNPMPGDPSRTYVIQVTGGGDMVCVVAHEVTGVERLESALRESNARLDAAMEASAAGMALVAPDGTFLVVNAALSALLGRTSADLIGSTWQSVTHPDDLEADREQVQDILDGRIDSFRMQKRFLRPDGSVVWGDLAVGCVRADDGSVRHLVSQTFDITAAREQEASLRAEEARYEELITRLPLGVYVYRNNAAGEVAYDFYSPQTARLVGADAAEVLRNPFAAVATIHPDDLAGMLALSEETRAAGIPFRWEGRFIVEGEVRRIRIEALPTQLPDGWTRWHGIAEDVTERRRADDELRRLATAVEQSGDSIVVTDLDARVVYANPAFERTSGYAPSEAIGENPSILSSGIQDDAFYAAMWETLTEGETWRGELHNRHKDGSIFIEEATITPVRGPDGEIANYVAVKRDVTAQKAAEAEIKRLVAAVDQAGESVVVTEPDGTIVYVNPEFERNSGYTREEAVGQNPRILQSGIHPRSFYEQMWATLGAGRVWRGELHNRRKDGSIHVEASTITPVFGADGRLESYVGVKRDVTDERRAEMTIRRSEERYRTLVAELDAIVWIQDRQSGEDYCSANAADMLGYPVEDLLRKGFWRTLVVPEDQEVMFRIWDTEDRAASSDQNYRLRRADGRVIWVNERWRAITDDQGQIVRWYGLTTDITRRRQLEETVARTDRLEAVARVTAAAAHDFGNVLQAIRFYQTLLASRVPATEAAAVDIAAIGQAVERGSALTRQMLAIGRDAPSSVPVPLDPAAVLADLAPMLKAIAAPCNLDLDAGTVGPVRVPRSALEQGVLNLVLNARDAMTPKPGTISVGLARETLPPDSGLGVPGGVYVALRVADDGPGMPPDVLERAMEPFFTTKAHGTGIGLASVYGAMREAGGTVRIESTVGAGTSVTILLPVLVPAARAAGAKPASRSRQPLSAADE